MRVFSERYPGEDRREWARRQGRWFRYQHLGRDGLTGTLSRPGLERAARRSVRLGKPAFLLGVLDGWRAIADTYGHLPSDEAIRRAFVAVVGAATSSAVVGRFGFKEFGLVLSEPDGAREIAAAIAAAVADTVVVDDDRFRLTATIGGDARGYSVDFEDANRALGAALAQRRIVFYDDLPFWD